MNIVVCVKQVPDTEVERSLVPGENTVDRASVDGVINYLDEFAIEEGLKIAEAQGGDLPLTTIKAAYSQPPFEGDKAVKHIRDLYVKLSQAIEKLLR